MKELLEDLPFGKPVNKASDREATRISNNRREGGYKGHGPENTPSAAKVFPALRFRFQPGEYLIVEYEEENRDSNDDYTNDTSQHHLERR